jgi:hypothetical protein
MRWPGTFSRSTPDRLWALMAAAWESGVSPPDDRVVEDCGNWERNVRWVVEAKGAVVPQLNCRHGRRLVKRKERRVAKRKAAVRRLPELRLLTAALPANSTPSEPDFDALPEPTPPTEAALNGMALAELQRRCGLLGLPETGSKDEARNRLRVYFNYGAVSGDAVAALLLMTGPPEEDSPEEDGDLDDQGQPRDDGSDDEDDDSLFGDTEDNQRAVRNRHRLAV